MGTSPYLFITVKTFIMKSNTIKTGLELVVIISLITGAFFIGKNTGKSESPKVQMVSPNPDSVIYIK